MSNVSGFNDAAGRLSIRAALLPQLSCPHCDATNRPGVSEVQIDDNNVACCTHCSHSGHIQNFLPHKEK